ncbi:carbon-nitrogen hydrolase family protein [Clostridium sp. SHJSY1]|uniref:carbon-nitrogen hydrolase family protein n=1 Tax=Clostridium sp. SHJSY1 TaxID=2942483 RepID=UPI0028751A30|nr:carbon-nitrogen hydrolase family protein [Clostridium sp. SHJSY1]MDS0527097.1 carbon-nitrogen hydrolase family protein [Clostridium sp. SHJSY1]
MKDNIKIAMIQMNIQSNIFGTEIRKENVKHACERMEDILKKEKDMDILILPEEFYAGAGYGPISLQDSIDKVKNDVFQVFGELAKKYNVYIAGALSAKLDPNSFRGNNIGFLIGRDGCLVGMQERFHLTENEKPFSIPATNYEVFDLDIGKVSLVIGVDILYPEISRNFILKGAEILINPILAPGYLKNNEYPNNLYKYCAITRALENQAFVIMVNGVGQFAHADMAIFGESLVAGPVGIIKKTEFDECCETAVLTIKDKVLSNKNMAIVELRSTEACIIKE